MAAIFTRPLSFSVIGADQAATAPAINAGDDRPGMVWRTTGTTGYVIIDMGTGASYDTVALISNIAAADTVRVRTGTGSTGTGTIDLGAQAAWTGNLPAGWAARTIIRFGSTRSERYLRIDFASAAVVEVQRVIVGPSISTKGIDYEAEHSVLDSSSIDTNLGVDTIQEGRRKLKWKFSMSAVDAADWRNYWVGFLGVVGKTRPILFCPFSDQAVNWQTEVTFGRIRNEASAKIISTNNRVVELTIEGLGL